MWDVGAASLFTQFIVTNRSQDHEQFLCEMHQLKSYYVIPMAGDQSSSRNYTYIIQMWVGGVVLAEYLQPYDKCGIQNEFPKTEEEKANDDLIKLKKSTKPKLFQPRPRPNSQNKI